jgi:hypothetical protein
LTPISTQHRRAAAGEFCTERDNCAEERVMGTGRSQCL